MRILHTGDWHIGQTLGGYSRDHEHRAVLDALVGIAVEREVDALIVAGDVFDSQNASGEAQALYFDTLLRLHRARPDMTMVITAGNHDAASRLEAPAALLEAVNARVIGNVRRNGTRIDARRHLVPLATRGELAAHALAVSYPTAACLPPLARYGGKIASATRDLYAELMDAVKPCLGGLPLIMTGHLHVAGGLESEGAERRILVGGEHAIAPADLPDEADYVALGHLHRAQQVGRPSIRYCGSLLPLSSSEQAYDHGVTLVTLGAGQPSAEHIAIPRPVPFLRLPAAGDVRLADLADHLKALNLEPALPLEQQPFLHVQLARDGLLPGHRAEVERIAEAFPVRIVDIRVTRSSETEGSLAQADAPPPRLADLDPIELFRQAYERAHGARPEQKHLDIVHTLAAED